MEHYNTSINSEKDINNAVSIGNITLSTFLDKWNSEMIEWMTTAWLICLNECLIFSFIDRLHYVYTMNKYARPYIFSSYLCCV